MNSRLSTVFRGSGPLVLGIWPRSITFSLVAFWCALFIIRPWEILIPELGDFRFERFYSLGVILIVVAAGKFRLLLSSFQTQAIFFFLASLTLSWAFAFRRDLGSRDLYVYLTLVVFYFVLISVVRTAYELWFLIACYVGIMLVYLSKAWFEYAFRGAGEWRMGVSRLTGIEVTFGHPNAVASSIVYSMPFWLFLWQTRKEVTETWPRKWKKLFKLGLAAYIPIAVAAVILTYSRSGMVGMLLFGLLVVWGGRRRTLATLALLLTLAVTVSMMPEDSKQRFESIWNDEAGQRGSQGSARGRIRGLKAGIAMFKASPVVGIGLGSFMRYRVRYVDNERLEAHNALGQVLGETGIVGLLGYCALVAGILLNCRRMKKLATRSRDPGVRHFLLLARACRNTVILLVFMGLFGHNLLRFNYLWIAAFALIGRNALESTLVAEIAAAPDRVRFSSRSRHHRGVARQAPQSRSF